MKDLIRFLMFVALATAAIAGQAQITADEALRIERMALEADRTESIRAIKHLHDAYAQFAQAGMWREMAALFAADGELLLGDRSASGPDSITDLLREQFGGGRDGLPAGGVQLRMNERPVINLAADGQSAEGRWLEFSTYGIPGGAAGWAGGIQTNRYILEGGRWKFARLHYHAKVAGDYAAGWTAVESDISVVPYHFTPVEAGTPIPELPAHIVPISVDAAGAADKLENLERRVGALVERDLVMNLYYSYGYYLDRKMWDDVTDLFTDDGELMLGGIGRYQGKRGIRRALENDGPAGLRRGEMNDHLLFNTIVEVSPSGVQARSRGLEFYMAGDTAKQTAELAAIVNEGRYEKSGGIWRIREIRSYPAVRSDYYQGWAKSSLPEAQPAPAYAPDQRAVEVSTGGNIAPVVTFFYRHPVTDAPLTLSDGALPIGSGMPFDEAAMRPADAPAIDTQSRIAEIERKLRVARAYDGVENISGAFGDWLDDFQWDKFSELFALDGRRRKYMLGFYTGPARIYAAETLMYGSGPRSPRTSVAVHHRLQRVIDVAPDGMSAKFRTRLLNIGMSQRPGSFMAGMYPNDAARLEDGVWRFMNTSIDEPYWTSHGYEDGWARVPVPEPQSGEAPALSPFFTRVLDQLPPDVPLSAMPLRQYGFVPGALISWPDIKPMWFHYRNPVSGREPPYYCPDEFTCEALLEAKQAGVPPVWQPIPMPEQVDATEGFIDVNGVKLWYWDTGGDGEPVVLLHPGSQSSEIWGYQQPYLAAAGYRVIAYSRRGVYRSEPGTQEDRGTAAADLAALLDRLGVERAHIIGAAAGGGTALAFTLNHPERALSLTLAGSIVGPTEPEWREMFGHMEMNAARRHLSSAFVELSASYRAGNHHGAQMFEALSGEATSNIAYAQPSGASINWETMQALTTPVLLLTGSADLYCPPSMQRLFAAHLRNHELAVVNEAAHAVYWEQPDEFNRIVGDFIRRHAATE
ncbi:MAG: alpha/beta fold hydrolase [Gammaproteobacteria bacterium]|nr:alpha/beta fold hydrolase [Gammaproteobacteria bacterium]